MRALSVRGPRLASVADAPSPEPGIGDVLLRVRACGVCGSDLNAWRGVTGVEYPLAAGAPGHEVWGEVRAVGSGVETLRVGEVVTGLAWNGFAERALARAENLVVVPSSWGDAPALGEPLACAMNVVRRSRLSGGDRLAIVGFGYLAALVVHLIPREVTWVAVSRRPDSRQLAVRLGADAAYDFSEIPNTLWDAFPVVIEAAGVQQTLDFATWLTAYSGRLVVAGYHADGLRTVNMQSWNWKGIDVINAHERDPRVYLAALMDAFERLGTGGRDLSNLITHRWPLSRAADAFQAAESRPEGFVKGVVCP